MGMTPTYQLDLGLGVGDVQMEKKMSDETDGMIRTYMEAL